jgi:hypothetical protein
MSITENLLNNESVVLEARKHWIAPVRDSVAAAGLVLVGLLLWMWAPSPEGFFSFIGSILDLLRWGVLIVGALWIVDNIIVWRTAEFAVTTLRVLRYEGLVQRRSSETLLTAVSDVKLSVGFLGKSLGYGDLRIFTQSGEAGADNFRSITQAAEFRDALMNVKIFDQLASRPAAPAPAAPTPALVAAGPGPAPAEDHAAKLLKLAELRDQGIVSPEEFEAKKAEILARM